MMMACLQFILDDHNNVSAGIYDLSGFNYKMMSYKGNYLANFFVLQNDVWNMIEGVQIVYTPSVL